MAKSGLLMALGMPKGKAGAEDEPEADTGGEAKRSAARSLISAVKSGDEDAVTSAFQSLYDACSMGRGSSEESDEEEEY